MKNKEKKKLYAPGTHGCHEALHMASYLASAVEEELCAHPAIKLNKNWLLLARGAALKLQRLYQEISKEHIT